MQKTAAEGDSPRQAGVLRVWLGSLSSTWLGTPVGCRSVDEWLGMLEMAVLSDWRLNPRIA